MRLFIAGSAKDRIPPSFLQSSSLVLALIAEVDDVHLVFGGYHWGIMAIAYDEFKKNSS